MSINLTVTSSQKVSHYLVGLPKATVLCSCLLTEIRGPFSFLGCPLAILSRFTDRCRIGFFEFSFFLLSACFSAFVRFFFVGRLERAVRSIVILFFRSDFHPFFTGDFSIPQFGGFFKVLSPRKPPPCNPSTAGDFITFPLGLPLLSPFPFAYWAFKSQVALSVSSLTSCCLCLQTSYSSFEPHFHFPPWIKNGSSPCRSIPLFR